MRAALKAARWTAAQATGVLRQQLLRACSGTGVRHLHLLVALYRCARIRKRVRGPVPPREVGPARARHRQKLPERIPRREFLPNESGFLRKAKCWLKGSFRVSMSRRAVS